LYDDDIANLPITLNPGNRDNGCSSLNRLANCPSSLDTRDRNNSCGLDCHITDGTTTFHPGDWDNG
jgi:hypothetical protein